MKHDKDVISRKGAINAVCTVLYPDADKMNDAKKVLKEMPSAQSEQRWIPCSDRLPKIGKVVLLSEPHAMFIAEYHGSGNPEGLWVVNECHHYLADVNGCAWMPLPEPYQEEGETDALD